MKTNVIKLICAGLVLVLATSCQGNKRLNKCKHRPIELTSAFNRVHQAVQDAIAEANDEVWKLEQADLTFENVSTITTGGGIKLAVFNADFSRSTSRSNSVTFSFTEKPKFKAKNAEPAADKLKDFIRDAIKNANTAGDVGEFDLSEIDLEVSFTIICSVEGGVAFEIAPVTPSASISREKESVHTITLKLVRKAPAAKAAPAAPEVKSQGGTSPK